MEGKRPLHKTQSGKSPHRKNLGPDSWKAHFEIRALERTVRKLNYPVLQVGTAHGDDPESPQQSWILDPDLPDSAPNLNHKRLSRCPSAQDKLMPKHLSRAAARWQKQTPTSHRSTLIALLWRDWEQTSPVSICLDRSRREPFSLHPACSVSSSLLLTRLRGCHNTSVSEPLERGVEEEETVVSLCLQPCPLPPARTHQRSPFLGVVNPRTRRGDHISLAESFVSQPG